MCIPTCFEIAWAGAGEQERCPCGTVSLQLRSEGRFMSLMQNLERVFTRFKAKKRVGVERPVSAAPRTRGAQTPSPKQACSLAKVTTAPGAGRGLGQPPASPGIGTRMEGGRRSSVRGLWGRNGGCYDRGPSAVWGTHFWFPSLIVTLQSYPAPFHAWGNRYVIYTAS